MSDSTKLESTQPVLHVKYPGQDAAPKPQTIPSVSQTKVQTLAVPQGDGAAQAEVARKEREEASEDPSNLISPPKKPGLSSRLSRMFSSSGKPGGQASTAASRPESSVSQATTAVSDRQSESDGASSSRAPSIVSSAGLSSRPPSRTPSHTGRQTSKERELAAPPMERKNSKSNQAMSGRFQLLEDGHTHTLKSAKRQEKLSDMLRDAFGAKRKDGDDQYQQLSLMSSWVDNLKSEKDKLAADKKGGPNQTETLVQKYGKCQEIVGRGAFGIVRISHKPAANGEQLYAVKEFRRRPSESAKKYQKRLTSEFCISSSLRHPNVIHTLDLLQDAKGDYCEVMEFCAGGDLYTLVLAAGKLEVAEADCFFKQLMRGVEYLHEMGVAHRDLKPENLLLTCRGALKITDFGNGECFRMAWEKDAHMTSGMCGSGPYIAPEEWCENEFDPRAVDIWATGVIYMAMRTGRHLWHEATKDDEFFANYLADRKSEDGFKPIEVLKRAKCRNVIYSILDPNPTRRITASQVLKSEWGRGIKICTAGEEGL